MPETDILNQMLKGAQLLPVVTTVFGVGPAVLGNRWPKFSWMFLCCGLSVWSLGKLSDMEGMGGVVQFERLEWWGVALVLGLLLGGCAFFLRKVTKILLALIAGGCVFATTLGMSAMNFFLAVPCGVAATLLVGWLHEKLEGLALAGCGAVLIALAWGWEADYIRMSIIFASALLIQLLWRNREKEEKKS